MGDVGVTLQVTPNPNALKFILTRNVKNSGKSSYKTPVACEHVPLANELFSVRGIDQVHLFQNVITITKFGYEDWELIEKGVIDVINNLIDFHDPEYMDPDKQLERREALTPELQEIEGILDGAIRSALQADGGDLQCISYEDNVLIIKYLGACGGCPSSQFGTLEAIKHILREKYNPHIDVYSVPEY
ncbi:MAG: NifU family protein [Bacteriovoracaceae bacterium]|jgi:NFU1 iron-sulfur cluster scaffold homolog, mitochondrial|nr:NifU family protein [Bacteriovoracaceae bacterium]